MVAGCTIDERAVEGAGGRFLPEGAGVAVGGWEITCAKAPITADAEVDVLKERLGSLAWPEQFFGANHLTLVHPEAGTRLTFEAEDALRAWLSGSEAPVHVKTAGKWMQAHAQDVDTHKAKVLQYDWTFTTGYRGSGAGPAGPQSAHGSSGELAWEATDAQMDRGMLTARDPILMYADIPLFESELEDNGVASLSVKVRVMPRCWYALLRFWLRVDGVLVRLRTTRVFCAFKDAPDVVLRETTYQEGTFAALAAAGAPREGPSYADADAAGAALAAVAPVGVTLYERQALQLKEGGAADTNMR